MEQKKLENIWGNNMDGTGEVFEVTKIISNIKQHPFEIADYKMSFQEAEVVKRALQMYLQIIEPNKSDE